MYEYVFHLRPDEQGRLSEAYVYIRLGQENMGILEIKGDAVFWTMLRLGLNADELTALRNLAVGLPYPLNQLSTISIHPQNYRLPANAAAMKALREVNES